MNFTTHHLQGRRISQREGVTANCGSYVWLVTPLLQRNSMQFEASVDAPREKNKSCSSSVRLF